MKLFNLITANIICFLFMSFQSKTTSAFEFFTEDSLCCDTANIYSESDSSNVDSCFGTIYFFILPDTNCVIKSVVTNDLDTIIWVDSISTYYGKYAISRGTTKNIFGYFLNYLGDTVCTKNLTLQCQSCCDTNMIFSVADTEITNPCSGMVYFPFDTLCEIVLVRTNIGADSLIVWDTTYQAYGIPYYVSEGDSIEVFGYFVGHDGDTICIQSIKIYCEKELDCCDIITFQDFPNPVFVDQPCCGTFTVDIGDCGVGYFEYFDLSPSGPQQITQTGPFTYEYCINYGVAFNVQFNFYTSTGELICEKTFSKFCLEGLLKRKSIKNEIQGNLKIYPNPAETEFKIVFAKNYDLTNMTINIYSINGTLVKSKAMQPIDGFKEVSIDVSDLNQGVYMIEVQKPESIVRSKITIIR